MGGRGHTWVKALTKEIKKLRTRRKLCGINEQKMIGSSLGTKTLNISTTVQ